MQRHEEIYDMIRDYEESDDATEDMLSLASEIDALTAERDRLAAENAELQYWKQGNIRCAKALTAANATLDRLREVGIDPSYHGNPADWANEDKLDSLIQFQAILYPPETTSIRDTAAAHGFDAMPDDLAQRSVDSETNYVQLNPENDHANHD